MRNRDPLNPVVNEGQQQEIKNRIERHALEQIQEGQAIEGCTGDLATCKLGKNEERCRRHNGKL